MLAIASAIGVLFIAYWRESLTVPVNSDGAANALQGWSMLHGNLLLHGWWVSDISFYTTELPQYALLEAVAGLGPAVVHIADAMTYVLIVALLALVGRGDAAGREGWYRAAIAAVIAIAPLTGGAAVLLANPDHTGTMVPVLLTWLLIDRGRPGAARRWPVPGRPVPGWLVVVAVWLLIALTMVADKLVLLVLVAPLVVAVAIRAMRRRASSYELWLAAAALAAAVAGCLAQRAISALGGYRQWGTMTDRLPVSMHGAWMTFRSVLLLFGADVFGPYPVTEIVLAAVRLVAVGAVCYGLLAGLARFFRADGVLVPALAVAFALTTAAYLVSVHSVSTQGVREMVAVLPAGALLAARALPVPASPRAVGTRLPVGTRLATGGVLACFLASLAYGVSQQTVPPYNANLASWLTEHHMTGGLGGYWVAASTTLDTHGSVLISSVRPQADGRLGCYEWETDEAACEPRREPARFLVAGGPVPTPGMVAIAERTFGRPRRVVRLQGGYTVLIWDKNPHAGRFNRVRRAVEQAVPRQLSVDGVPLPRGYRWPIGVGWRQPARHAAAITDAEDAA